MRSLDKRILFLTNNASKSRAQYKQKFDSLGIEVAPEEVRFYYCRQTFVRGPPMQIPHATGTELGP